MDAGPITVPDTRAKRFYNNKQSSMRFRIEHAYGRLKWKFPALSRGLLFSLDRCPLIINACVVLYNFILEHEGDKGQVVFTDSGRTKRTIAQRRGSSQASGGSASGGGGAAANIVATPRDREVEYLEAGGFLQAEWGEPGSRADRRRERNEAQRKRQAVSAAAGGSGPVALWASDVEVQGGDV